MNNNIEYDDNNDNNNNEKIIPTELSIGNIFLIIIISSIYVLLVNKFAEIASFQINDEENSISTYVMIIYLISIICVVFVYLFLNDITTSANFVMNYSLIIGSIVLLFYSLLNHWNNLDDYGKCVILLTSMIGIIYFLYKTSNDQNNQ